MSAWEVGLVLPDEVVSERHKSALEWFAERQNQVVGWDEIVSGTGYSITTQKGIYKPADSRHALSVRRSLGSTYEDREPISQGGSWAMDYFQEGRDLDHPEANFTNRAMLECMRDGVPIGVIDQLSRGPARYRILGLAHVAAFERGFFHLREVRSDASTPPASTAGHAEPVSLEDARKRIEAQIVARQGQEKFRKQALAAFNHRCAVTGCDAVAVLEAAHIVPYLGVHTNTGTNCLLLRSDIHTLFDRDLLTIDPVSLKVALHSSLKSTIYAELDGRTLVAPRYVDTQTFRANLLLRKH